MPLLEVENLTGGYTKKNVLKNIRFSVEKGENRRTYWVKWCREKYDN